MTRKHGHIIILLSVAAIVINGLMASCGGTKSKKVLSFFFDGVPTEQDSTLTDSVGNKAALEAFLRSEERRKEKLDSVQAGLQAEMHSPYAEGECSSCHNMPDKGGTSSGNSSMPSLSTGQASGSGWLVMPVEELCIECHTDKTEEFAEENDMEIHGPVATGECTTCHHPHRSKYKHLLLAEPVRKLCFQCHEENIPEGFGDHPELEDTDDCIDCHNPHMSTEEFFLE